MFTFFLAHKLDRLDDNSYDDGPPDGGDEKEAGQLTSLSFCSNKV